MTEETYPALLDEKVEDHVDLTPFKFQKCFYCTRDFDAWWKDYYIVKFVNIIVAVHS